MAGDISSIGDARDAVWNDIEQARRLAGEAPVRQAAEAAQALMSLWPLTKSLHMGNDAKYAENLQVRITRQAAMLLIGDPELAQSVTEADADFVYEGADTIPGRPQPIVDALLAANDAYDAAADYSDDGDAAHFIDAASAVGAELDDVATLTSAVDEGEAFLAETENVVATQGDSVERIALVASACGLATFNVLLAARATAEAGDGNLTAGAIVGLLYLNELGERHGLPRTYLTAGQMAALDRPMPPADFVRALAPAAEAEWERHRTDILWDPDKAETEANKREAELSRKALDESIPGKQS